MNRSPVIGLALFTTIAGSSLQLGAEGMDVCRNRVQFNRTVLPAPVVIVRTEPGGPCAGESPDGTQGVQPRLLVRGAGIYVDASAGANWQ